MTAAKSGFQLSKDLMQSLSNQKTKSFYIDAHRSDLIHQINHHWRFSGSVLLHANKGVGKTAFIQHFQRQLDDDVICIYVDAATINGGEAIIDYLLETLGLDGGPIKSRKEKIERVLQHVELEVELGHYILLIIDHFDQLSENSQRFFIQLVQRTHSQLRQIFVVDSAFMQANDIADGEELASFELLPLHSHKAIHFLNDILHSVGSDIHKYIHASRLEDFIAQSGGNLNTLQRDVLALVEQTEQAELPKQIPVPKVKTLTIVLVSIIVSAAIYVMLVGENDVQPEVSTISIAIPISSTDNVDNKLPSSPLNKIEPQSRQPLTPISLESSADIVESEPVQMAINQPINIEQDSPVEQALDKSKELQVSVEPIRPRLETKPEPVTIQLMVVSEVKTLEEMVSQYRNLPLEIIKTKRDGRDMFVLVHGAYADKNSARAAIELLPAQLKKASPWVRFKADI